MEVILKHILFYSQEDWDYFPDEVVLVVAKDYSWITANEVARVDADDNAIVHARGLQLL